jgi:putative tryptophan/tyrosine transport system substrate-binding protein
MNRCATLAFAAAFLLAVPGFTLAQASSTTVRIGYIGSSSAASDKARTEAFRQGLRERGYVEGKNTVVEWRYPEGSADRLPALVADLVQRKVQVIVVAGATATQAVKNQVSTIPIVMTNVSDPVGLRLVEGLAKPGGNITGLTNVAPELGSKRLELLKELVPNLSRVAVLGDPGSPAYAPQIKGITAAAGAIGLDLQLVEVRDSNDLESAFASISKARADGLIALQNPTITRLATRIAELAAKARLPAMYPQREFVEAGGLISYGPDIPDLHRQAAYFVDRIVKGAKPADLPVEQPKKYELAVNLRSAKQIGLTISPHVLFRADQTIQE